MVLSSVLITAEESCSPTYAECGTALCALVNGTEECYCEQGFQLDYNGTGCSGMCNKKHNTTLNCIKMLLDVYHTLQDTQFCLNNMILYII